MAKKGTIFEMQQIAIQRGGQCLSLKYIDSYTPLIWKCKNGHIWKARPNNIKFGKWCRKCANKASGLKQRLTISEMQSIAESRGGLCLSKKYRTQISKLKWQCSKGHIWKATPVNVKHGSWCHVCWGKAGSSLHEMKNLARKMGGKCLSRAYENYNTKLKWQCAHGHVWNALPGPIKERSVWCPNCRNILIAKMMKKRKPTLLILRQFASKMNGELVTTNYDNAHIKLLWKCHEGHTFSASWHQISHSKSWCPTCNTNVNEIYCRIILENIFGKAFPKIRPTWLRNTRGNLMELDGYCKKLQIGFEYHGQQHYRQIKHFYKKYFTFQQRQQDDQEKINICTQNNVKLLIIPFDVDQNKLQEYIINLCMRRRIKLPPFKMLSNEKILESVTINKPNYLDEVKTIAAKKGGKCLTNRYYNAHTKMRFICKEGHIWEASAHSIKEGNWCRICASYKRGFSARLGIEKMQELAKRKNGLCLSIVYIGAQSKLQWQCKDGHVWLSRPDQIKRGQWCPICAIDKRKKN